ncbi:MAG: AAA family ATPase [Vicinamibacterales bacterium]
MVTDDQHAVLAWLASPAAYGDGVTQVERIDTHAAVVFLAGDRAWKLKRAVRYDYLDYSTVEQRHACCQAELARNADLAPGLYRRVVPVTREASGGLAIGGEGPTVDWLLEMQRFDNEALCDRLAARGALPLEVMPALATAVAAMHARSERRVDHGGAAGLRWVIDGNLTALRAAAGVMDAAEVEALGRESQAALTRHATHLDTRQREGLVRLCHGDLHLRNLVMWRGAPTPFDAVEFNDEIACIDVGYDLAFLLMDLWRRQLPRHANAVLGEYLQRTGDIELLAPLPLFLSCRAAVRAKTSIAAADLASVDARPALHDAAREYLRLARAFLDPAPARLVAVGGRSGSGKSTLAAALAPRLGAAPGAWVLRSDVARKRLFAVSPETRLDASAYSHATTARVYAGLRVEARLALDAGHAVVCDATFTDATERAALARVADDAGVPFVGLWLDAPDDVLLARVTARQHDASDADAAVVRAQPVARPDDWTVVDASGDAPSALAAAQRTLGLDPRA